MSAQLICCPVCRVAGRLARAKYANCSLIGYDLTDWQKKDRYIEKTMFK